MGIQNSILTQNLIKKCKEEKLLVNKVHLIKVNALLLTVWPNKILIFKIFSTKKIKNFNAIKTKYNKSHLK